jgi:hypothetical protein
LKRLLQHRAISVLSTHARRSIPGRKDERHILLAKRVGYRVSVLAIQVQVEDRYFHLLLADEFQRTRNIGGRSDQLATEFVDFKIQAINPTALPVFGDIPNLVGRDFDEVIRILWPKMSSISIAIIISSSTTRTLRFDNSRLLNYFSCEYPDTMKEYRVRVP